MIDQIFLFAFEILKNIHVRWIGSYIIQQRAVFDSIEHGILIKQRCLLKALKKFALILGQLLVLSELLKLLPKELISSLKLTIPSI